MRSPVTIACMCRNFMFELSENFPLPELRRVLPIFSDFMNGQ